ncbi:hypothetical protein LTR17_010656 [Elasticomyces elasticus]|nr:hypothetical protein LTR17_010656 [Elasticomyces elasticus]
MDKTGKSDPTLLGLPVELQTQIAEWLLLDTEPEGRNAILHLRTACKDFHAVCASKTTLLKKRFTKLYLHPTRLVDVLAVCGQVDLVADVVELVVLGRSTVSMFPSQDDDREFDNDYANMDDRYDHRPWPQFFSSVFENAPKRSYAELERIDERGDCFAENYQGLIDALRNLSHVRKLTYTGGVCGPGLCQVSDADLAHHAREHADWRRRFDIPGMPSTQHGCVAHGWSDTEVVTVLLTGDVLGFSEVDFRQPPPICEGTKLPRLLLSGSVRSPLRQMQSLVLAVPGHYGWHEYYHDLFAGAAALKDMKIVVSSRIDQWWRDHLNGQRHPTRWFGSEWALADLPWTLPSVVHLASISVAGTSHILDAFVTKPMVDLLRHCQGTLRSVEFKNVFFSGLSDDTEDINLRGATRTMLQAIKDLKSQQPGLTFGWTVRRLHCMRGCRVSSSSAHKSACEKYSPPQTDLGDGVVAYYWPFAETDFVMLASEFGACEEGDCWNFARADMLVSLPDE